MFVGASFLHWALFLQYESALPPLSPPLSHRHLSDNSLSGSVPSQLGALTALSRL